MTADLKKVLCLWVAFILLVLFPVPAYAATPNYKLYLKETYGITQVYVEPGAESLAAEALGRFDAACRMIGVDAAREIIREWVEVRGRFRLAILLPEGSFFALMDDEGSLNLYVNPGPSRYGIPTGFVCTVKSAVHEMMHAADYGLFGECKAISTAQASWAIGQINGEYEGYTDENQYVSKHAADNAFEDFADTAAIMICAGGDEPCTLDKSTLLHQKYTAAYQLLRRKFGEETPMVQRCKAFLGG